MNINIAYSLNSDFCYQILVSMKSAVLNNKNNNITFYLVSNRDIDKKETAIFNEIERENNVRIKYVVSPDTRFGALKNKIFLDEYFCWLALAELTDVDRVLCLYHSTYVNSDLSSLFNTDLKGSPCASPEHIYGIEDISKPFGIETKTMLNPFVMLMDLKVWRENNLLSSLISVDLSNVQNLEKMSFVPFLNTFLPDYKMLDFEYGYTEMNSHWHPGAKPVMTEKTRKAYKDINNHILEPKIICYVNEIPLCETSNCNNSYLGLWWEVAQLTEIYKDIKSYNLTNRYKLSATTAKNSFKYGWLLSRIWPYIKPYMFRIILGFLIAVPLGLLDGVTAFMLKPYIDYVVNGKVLNLSFLGSDISFTSLQIACLISLGVVLFAAAQGVLRYLNDYISCWTSQKITNSVKIDLFHRLVHMHPQFFDINSSGIVISRYMGDPATASAGIVDQIKTITTSLCGALGLIAVMIYSSPRLALIGVVVLFIAFLPVALIRKRVKAASNKSVVIGGNMTTNINETYSGNKVMAAYELQGRQENNFKNQIKEAFNVTMSLVKRTAWMSPLMYIIASFGIAGVLGYGTYLINTGAMTAGSFTSFVTSLLLLYKPVKTLGNTLAGVQVIFVAMGRVFELFDLDSAIKDPESPKELRGLDSNIAFENVSFEYQHNVPVLKNINLTVRKNETLAIVGNSGGGKSTIVNLIPRFYDIKEGSIKIDGTDIREFSIHSLRQNISMVFQDNFLYSGTIKENIMMGKQDATYEEFMAAIESAHLRETIADMPEGADTMLGERGLTLSGGQRQRVAIARAMLRNAPIVILDEATSALDNESEAIVQKAMDNLMQNRTVFIIAHRLSTIKNADRIAVINEGELVELGTHDELMNIENGHYRALYEMQFKKTDDLVMV